MSLECPRCGKAIDGGRFYCASCGQELQPSHRAEDQDLRPPLKYVHDVDSRAVTLIMVGITVCIAGFIAYTFGLFWGSVDRNVGAAAFPWPFVVMAIGLCVIGLGLDFNWSQRLPGIVRLVTSIELISAISGFVVMAALVMQVTEWADLTDETGHNLGQVAVYGHRATGVMMVIPFGICPLGIVIGLHSSLRSACAAGMALSLVSIILSILVLASTVGLSLACLLAGIQAAFFLSLLVRPVRRFFTEGKPAVA